MTMSLKLIFWICFTAAMIVYVTMLTWTIPAIKEAAGGIAPFDMRPMGYDASDAQAFLQALTPDGRQLYLGVQSQLDTFYPALMAISLGLGMYLLSPVRWKLGRWIGAACAFRRTRSAVPTASGRSFRSIRSPEDHCCVGKVLDVRRDVCRQPPRQVGWTGASSGRRVRGDRRCGPGGRGWHRQRLVRR